MPRKRKVSRRAATPSVWEALNEPIAYPSQEFTRHFFLAVVVILLMAWVSPYWSQASVIASVAKQSQWNRHVVSLRETPRDDRNFYVSLFGAAPQVAGVQEAITSNQETITKQANLYYLVLAVAENAGQAANEILDISEPVIKTWEFYEPGVQAAWEAWLQLMADPQF